MKAVMFLSVSIGVLLSLLFFVVFRYVGAGRVNSAHVKVIERNADGIIKSICHNQVEYLLLIGNGTAISVATDASGKPLHCNY